MRPSLSIHIQLPSNSGRIGCVDTTAGLLPRSVNCPMTIFAVFGLTPFVWSGRALQEDFVELAAAVLHQCIRPLIGACGAPGHHGYQRACVLVHGQASTGHLGHLYSHALGKPNLHLVSSSRKPRLAVDWVTSSLAPHIAQFLCSSQGPFLRPGPQNVDRVARRGGQGRPSHLACGWLRRCRAAP